MFMRMKKHKQVIRELHEHNAFRVNEANSYCRDQLGMKDQELARLRGDLFVAHNEIAQLKGELMAAHHAAGKPSTRARKLPPQDAPQ